MHQVSIPPSVVDRIVARRGQPHCFAGLDPRKSALVVIDMQNAFMLPGVGHAPCATAPEIVPNINRIARTLRAAGGTVVWVRTRFTENSLTAWSTYYAMLTPAAAAKRIAALTAGGKGYELWPELDVLPADLAIDKERFSAFLPGSSDLARILRVRGIDTVIVTGTVTNVCCELTARDAMMMNFNTIMVTDANAAANDAEHNAALIAFYLNFGDIMPTGMVVACLERNAAGHGDPEAAAAQ